VSQIKEYRNPLLIAAVGFIVALLVWAVLVSPENSKLSSLQGQETQLETQATGLQAKLASLKTEQQKLSSSCADLQKIATQIPSVQSPTDIDAEESSFESQFNALTASSGVSLTQFSGFTPATSTTATTTSSSASTSSGGVVPVPTTLTVKGDYGQMTSFINGLDSFPRLFVIQSFALSYGTAAASSSTGSASGTSSSGSSTGPAAPSANATPLWVGGTANAPTAGPYSLAIDGSIYYTATPNALNACTKATAAVAKDTK
jgi:Tfp pilus assembly protein PilO